MINKSVVHEGTTSNYSNTKREYQQMYLHNKYTRIYYQIVERAKDRIISDYTENHHIIPKSLGGVDSKENIVALTAREHFICHWLLTKMVNQKKQKYQMVNAFTCMLYRENNKQKRYKITSRKFSNIKKEISKTKSKAWSGENNPMFGKTHSQEVIDKIVALHKGAKRSPETGKKLSKLFKGVPKPKHKCPHCQGMFSSAMLSRWHGDRCKSR